MEFENWQKKLYELSEGRLFTTVSDAGGLKIGNGKFNIIIPSGGGDGETKVAIFENQKEFDDKLLTFFTSVRGSIDIFDYDCGNDIITTINGNYFIYNGEGWVVFVKFDY